MRIYVGFLLFISILGIHAAVTPEPVTTDTEPTVKTTKSTTSAPATSPATDSSTTVVPTTHVPPTTTSTEAPTTTTVVTTEPVPTTTEKPTEGPSTTIAPTESPTPDVGNWTVSDGNITCIKAEMGIRITVKNVGPNANETITHNLSPAASSIKSQCNYDGKEREQSLVLQDGDYVLTFIFTHNKVEIFVQNISLSFSEEKDDERTTSGKFFVANKDSSYFCTKENDIEFQNVTLNFSRVQVQAFGTDNSTEFRKEQRCYADEKMNDIVPIAVAAVLCGMVVIILIGYLIGRRQNRPRGYQSM